jgi:hypothetical protein
MLLPALIALLALWALAAVVAVSLCVVAGRSDRRHPPLHVVGGGWRG